MGSLEPNRGMSEIFVRQETERYRLAAYGVREDAQ